MTSLVRVCLLSSALLLINACDSQSSGGTAGDAQSSPSAVELAVALRSSASSDGLQVGDTFDISVEVLNQASVQAEQVTLSVPIPSNVRYLGGTESCQLVATESAQDDNLTQLLECALQPLAGGSSQTLTLPLQALDSGEFDLTVSAASLGQDDQDINNNFIRLSKLVNACADCPEDRELTLLWNPGEGDVAGYHIYFGTNANEVNRLITTLEAGESSQLSFRTWWDLGVQTGDLACFSITAFNEQGESAASEPTCNTVL